jgi:hypothetical protein
MVRTAGTAASKNKSAIPFGAKSIFYRFIRARTDGRTITKRFGRHYSPDMCSAGWV